MKSKYQLSLPSQVNEETSEPTALTLIEKLYCIRDTANKIHLEQRIRSFAVHKAMEELYTGILDIADDIAECYMGLYGQQTFNFCTESYETATQYVQDCYQYINQHRYLLSESFFQNEIDTIQKLLAKTLYRLQFVTSAPS